MIEEIDSYIVKKREGVYELSVGRYDSDGNYLWNVYR